MTARFISVYLGSLALVATAFAAPAPPSSPVTVDGKGKLRIPAKTLRQLGVKPDRTGSIWVVFPAVPPRHEKPAQAAHDIEAVKHPPRFLVAIDQGQITIPRTRIDREVWVPGKPGTRYLATGSGHELRLRKP